MNTSSGIVMTSLWMTASRRILQNERNNMDIMKRIVYVPQKHFKRKFIVRNILQQVAPYDTSVCCS